MHLVRSKSRINPVQNKGLTVPRLELNAALLLSKLMAKTYETLKIKANIQDVYLFSDSQIVLAWLKTELTKLHAYVGNRVNVIRQNTARWSWQYVNMHENPADLVSRGARQSELRGNELWWHGPLRNNKRLLRPISSWSPCQPVASLLPADRSRKSEWTSLGQYNIDVNLSRVTKYNITKTGRISNMYFIIRYDFLKDNF